MNIKYFLFFFSFAIALFDEPYKNHVSAKYIRINDFPHLKPMISCNIRYLISKREFKIFIEHSNILILKLQLANDKYAAFAFVKENDGVNLHRFRYRIADADCDLARKIHCYDFYGVGIMQERRGGI